MFGFRVRVGHEEDVIIIVRYSKYETAMHIHSPHDEGFENAQG